MFFGVLLLSGMVCAEPDPVILTVSGSIAKLTNKKSRIYEFRESDLRALKQHSIVTKTSWTPESTFSGPLIDDVLKTVGASGSRVKLFALNDYAYTLNRDELEKYNVILARSINNKRLEIKDRGPLWLMYPLPDMPAAERGPLLDAKLIWQVNRIVVY
ncbi:oxidoreductase [Chromobacterium sphagni]|uniref:oxidoreductase n=1 Tax=Chromobacterium sphagni TaxID=1903179 RepID=UPI001300E2DA|nr:oxidoreductase [Chromobacterium sphagni]